MYNFLDVPDSSTPFHITYIARDEEINREETFSDNLCTIVGLRHRHLKRHEKREGIA